MPPIEKHPYLSFRSTIAIALQNEEIMSEVI